MNIKDHYLADVLAGKEKLLFDGAMGTMLLQSGIAMDEHPEYLCLTQPDIVTGIHRAYVQAGSQAVTTNTFGANRLNLGDSETVARVFEAAVDCARAAQPRYVAADIGPLGEFLDPVGDIEFDEAVELFAEQARAAEAAGADLVIIETMSDLQEAEAAISAVRDNTDLPVFATMTFGEGGRTFFGVDPETAAEELCDFGADAVGVNCSLGPVALQPIVETMIEVSSKPVIVQANAGLPDTADGGLTYAITPQEYAQAVAPMVQAGATIVGGCCGTDPHVIAELAKLL